MLVFAPAQPNPQARRHANLGALFELHPSSRSSPSPMRKSTLGFALFTLTLTACGGGGGGGGGSVELDGTVAFVPETPAPIAPLVLEGPSRGIDLDRPRVEVDSTRLRRVRGEITDGVASVRLHSRTRQQIVARLAPGSIGRLAHLDPLSLDVGVPAREVRFLARGPFELIVRDVDEKGRVLAHPPLLPASLLLELRAHDT